MPDRLLLVTAPKDMAASLLERAREAHAVEALRLGTERSTGLARLEILAAEEGQQELIDALTSRISKHPGARITILAVEATVPHHEPSEERKEALSKRRTTQSREELYASVARGAKPDLSYFLFVVLSTVVTVAGLVESSPAVVIGGMLIAPLLGPNLAFTLGVALGEQGLMLRSLLANLLGLLVILALSLPVGMILPGPLATSEILARTDVGFGSMAIALASGAAAALALTRGDPSALPGVMVAVALLPPATTFGLMVGSGQGERALGALTLLAVNIVCINIAAQVVFVMRGVTARTWYAKEKARRGRIINAAIWLLLLLALAALLAARPPA